MKISTLKNIGFYTYSYYQAKDVIHQFKNYNIPPFIGFNYFLVNGLGIEWVYQISELLLKDYTKKDFKFFLNCNKNPALVINCMRYGFSYIRFDGNKILQKKIININNHYNININPKIKIIDLKEVKNCKIYINKIINFYINIGEKDGK